MERVTGYYWVGIGGQRRIAEYFDIPKCWYLTGQTESLQTEDFEMIDKIRIDDHFKYNHLLGI